MRILLIGGARSGKSVLASQWAAERATDVCFLATATGSDPEMVARIAAHRRERPAHWSVREAPVRLGQALREEAEAHAVVLVDCLTLWIANCLWPAPGATDLQSDYEPDYGGWHRERADFVEALRRCSGEVIVVSNEVGTGIVPDSRSGRIFRDEQGWLNQAVAAVSDEVFLVAAGLPLRLKPTSR